MTREEEIKRIVKTLQSAWLKYPHLRLGQLATNAPYFEADGRNSGFSLPAFLVEDDRMEEGLQGLLAFEETP